MRLREGGYSLDGISCRDGGAPSFACIKEGVQSFPGFGELVASGVQVVIRRVPDTDDGLNARDLGEFTLKTVRSWKTDNERRSQGLNGLPDEGLPDMDQKRTARRRLIGNRLERKGVHIRNPVN